jgi:hypothetical protein
VGRFADFMKTDEILSNRQSVSLIIILPLLIIARITYSYWPEGYLEAFIFLILFALIVINKENLQDLCVDQAFVLILALTGILYSLYIWTSIIGYITISLSIYLVQLLIVGKLEFGKFNLSSIMTTTLISIALALLVVLFLSGSQILQILQHAMLDKKLFLWAIYTNLLAVLQLEMIFWGLLWLLLRIRGTSNVRIFVIQVILFLILSLLIHPFHFAILIIIPVLIGVWQGFLAWRSKSLTPGTTGFFLAGLLLNSTSLFK